MIKDQEIYEALTIAGQALPEGRGLPSPLYTNDTWFEKEREAVFQQGWFALALSVDCQNLGDVTPIEFMRTSYLLTRDKQGV